ncbi:MAG TPA: CADD family putative folate metabolism protein [Ignavibacteria bacterium]|nr:CADD family putative folate metabolism protein [Ignavibacteria bacterium]
MMQTELFVTEINDKIASKSLLNHPFYQKWNEGTLTQEMLKEYAKQYYHFVKHFPRFVSCVHSNCDDFKTREMLMANLADEEGYKSEFKNHPALWMDFAKSLGLKEDEVRNTTPLRETEYLVDGMYELSRSNESQLGIAALYAYESQVPEISKTKIDGLNKFYGINKPEDIAYFTVHEEFDVYHSKEELDAIIASCKTEEDQKRVVTTVDEAAALQWNFLDGIYNTYCVN